MQILSEMWKSDCIKEQLQADEDHPYRYWCLRTRYLMHNGTAHYAPQLDYPSLSPQLLLVTRPSVSILPASIMFD
jgi:hypothetical protein